MRLSIIITILLFASQCFSATYYTTQSGAGGQTGADCSNAKSISWVNSNMSAGDIAYLCSGTFTSQLNPSNSGTSTPAYIKYIADPAAGAWNVIVSQSGSVGAVEHGQDYIWYEDLYFYDCSDEWVYLTSSATYNVLKDCKFYDSDHSGGVWLDGDYNKVIGCTFPDAPNRSNCGEIGDPPYPTDDSVDCHTAPSDSIHLTGTGNIIEDCTFGTTSHGAILCNNSTDDSIVRGCTFNNDLHGNLHIQGTVLVENNFVWDGGANHMNNPNYRDRMIVNGTGIYSNANTAIVRYNTVVGGDIGINFSAKSSMDEDTDDGRYYHNTVWNSSHSFKASTNSQSTNTINDNHMLNNIFGKGIGYSYSIVGSGCAAQDGAFEIDFCAMAGTNINYTYNNVFLSSAGSTFFYKTSGAPARTLTEVETAWPTEIYDNITVSSPHFADEGGRDFGLTTNSIALIDAAIHLTQVNDSGGGSGTSMVVDDSIYFYDGWSISGETGDTIYVDNPSSADFEVVISSINYSTHTLTLASSETWDDDALVYFCPSGVCFEGTAPDIGANEYDSDSPSVTVPVPSGRMSTGGQGGFGVGYGRLQ